MIRKIIHIDEEKCDGCGACVNACHEGAIDLINGKAKLMREHYCDGLGDCLPPVTPGPSRLKSARPRLRRGRRQGRAGREEAARTHRMSRRGHAPDAPPPG